MSPPFEPGNAVCRMSKARNLIPTTFLGQFFCGRICRLGSIHHLFRASNRSVNVANNCLTGIATNVGRRPNNYLLMASLVAQVFEIRRLEGYPMVTTPG